VSALKGALLGFGRVAEAAHAPAWRGAAGFVIAAVSDPDPQRRAAAEKALPGARTYASAGELLKRERGLDFADVAAPPFLHAELAGLSLARGLHVLCEKPLVLSRRDFDALRSEAERRRLALFTVHNWKHAPLLRRLREILRSGALGRLRHLELHTLRSRPAAVASASGNWRTDAKLAGGGILIDHGWHQLYLLHWLIGEAPLRASGLLRRPKPGAAEEEALCLVEFPSASAALYLSWRAERRAHWGVAYGEGGSAELKDDRILLARGDSPPQTFSFPEPLSAGSAHPEWFADTLIEFAAAVSYPAARAENLAEAESCLRIIESLYEAERAPRRIEAAA
jgi:predicted dehydrogenase